MEPMEIHRLLSALGVKRATLKNGYRYIWLSEGMFRFFKEGGTRIRYTVNTENAVPEGKIAVNYASVLEEAGLKVGARIRLRNAVDRLPDYVVKGGATGIISEITEYAVWAKMDQQIHGAEDWDNKIEWCERVGGMQAFFKDVEFLK